jgi:hypothetical protein
VTTKILIELGWRALVWIAKHVRIGDKDDAKAWIDKAGESTYVVIDVGSMGSLIKAAINAIEKKGDGNNDGD